MTRGQIWQKFPKLLRFMALFPSLKVGPEVGFFFFCGGQEEESTSGPTFQERKTSPKRKFSGRISRGHPGVIRADIPTQNFGQGSQNPEENKHFSADIHDPKVRTSTTLRDFQKLRSEKLWAEFSFPITTRDTPRRWEC